MTDAADPEGEQNPYEAPRAEAGWLKAKPTLNPWLSIWFSPTATIRQVVDTSPNRYLGVLVLLPFVFAGSYVAGPLDPDGFAPYLSRSQMRAGHYAGAAAGAAVGAVFVVLSGGLTGWAGRLLGGRGTAPDVRAAFAWAQVPGLLAAAAMLISANAIRLGPPDPVEHCLAAMGAGLVLVGGVWAVITLVATTAEVHDITVAQAFGAVLVICFMLLSIPIAFFAACFVAIGA